MKERLPRVASAGVFPKGGGLLAQCFVMVMSLVACDKVDEDIMRSRELLYSLAQDERTMRQQIDLLCPPLSFESIVREAVRRLNRDPIPSPDFGLKHPPDLEILAFVTRSVDKVCARLNEPDVPVAYRCDIPPLNPPIRHPAFVIFMPLIEGSWFHTLDGIGERSLRDRQRMLNLVYPPYLY